MNEVKMKCKEIMCSVLNQTIVCTAGEILHETAIQALSIKLNTIIDLFDPMEYYDGSKFWQKMFEIGSCVFVSELLYTCRELCAMIGVSMLLVVAKHCYPVNMLYHDIDEFLPKNLLKLPTDEYVFAKVLYFAVERVCIVDDDSTTHQLLMMICAILEGLETGVFTVLMGRRRHADVFAVSLFTIQLQIRSQ